MPYYWTKAATGPTIAICPGSINTFDWRPFPKPGARGWAKHSLTQSPLKKQTLLAQKRPLNILVCPLFGLFASRSPKLHLSFSRSIGHVDNNSGLVGPCLKQVADVLFANAHQDAYLKSVWDSLAELEQPGAPVTAAIHASVCACVRACLLRPQGKPPVWGPLV